MKQDEIIRMAREAGFVFPETQEDSFTCWWEELERFAALVAAHEREACAKVCDDKSIHCEKKAQEAIEAGEHDEVSAIRSTAWQISLCAAAIRERGQA